MKSQLSLRFQSISWKWWRLAGSNRWPPACKAGALPAELNPQIFHAFCVVGQIWLTFVFCVVGQNGLAFLRKSHAGYNMPPACCQAPAFESWLPVPSHSCLLLLKASSFKWWAKMDSNHRPHDYQSCALASWAIGPYLRLHIFLGTSFAVPSKLNNASSQNTLYWP